MHTFNSATVLGHLGADPEVRTTKSGTKVANLSVATNMRKRNKDGTYQDKTEWHRIVVFGEVAQYCGDYLVKGDAVLASGRIQTRKWTDDSGTEQRRTEIVAYKICGVSSDAQQRNVTPSQSGDESGPSTKPFDPKDIPF